MIFPGMDPYLENPAIWSGVHNAFIVYLRDQLQPRLRPRYVTSIEERVYVERQEWDRDEAMNRDRSIVPDASIRRRRPEPFGGGGAVALTEPMADEPLLVADPRLEIHEAYLTILDRKSGQEVVTVIELLNPTNKARGQGRESYLAKQTEVLASRSHLVEIDLLRSGTHTLAVGEEAASRAAPRDSLVCVSRAGGWRDEFELYPRRLRDRLPRIRIPLAQGDPDTVLDIQAVLAHTYEAGDFSLILDYGKPCVPPLSPEDQAWADALVQNANAVRPPA